MACLLPCCRAAPDGIGQGGVLLCPLGDDSINDAVADDSQAAAGVQAEPTAPASEEAPLQQSQAQGSAAGSDSLSQPPTHGTPVSAELAADSFAPASMFEGHRPGHAFKLGDQGLGYYLDSPACCTEDGEAGDSSMHSEEQETVAPAPGSSKPEEHGVIAASSGAGEQPRAGTPSPGPRHHWGQALQYLDRAVAVQPGRRLALLARREEGRLRFSLRQGVGEAVGRSPWKVEWGGGSSVENPHYQRVHYCQLLVRAQRARHAVLQPGACWWALACSCCRIQMVCL